jgi:NAD(P)-dependent dehydrogenase (short-subunit alcohol dehydrogenase family)
MLRMEEELTKDFEGKVAFVTGAGAGIGRSTALLFAANGARVVVADVAADDGRETVDLIGRAGGKASFVACDVSDEAAVEAAVAHTIATFGGLDCAVNNAGIDPELPMEAEWLLENFDKIINVNLRGVFLCMRRQISHMLEAGRGSIVNIGSVASVAGVRNKPIYTASKHGVLGFTRAAALQYAGRNIRINAICPGGVRTAIVEANLAHIPNPEAVTGANPTGRIAQPDEIAEAAMWLSSDRASYVTGHGMLVDGGLSV